MDFEVGTPQEHRWLCMNCPEPVYRKDVEGSLLTNTSSTQAQYYWAGRVRRVMDRSPALSLLANALVPFSLTLTLIFACNDELREFTAIPLVFFVVSQFLLEYIPLTYLPTGSVNAITNSGNKFRGAGKVAFYMFICIVVLSLGSELLNQYFNEVNLCTSNLTDRRNRVVKRAGSVTLFSIPLVYVFYLQVSNSFTTAVLPIDPEGEQDGKSNVTRVNDYIMKELPKANANSKVMQSIWKKRNKLQ